MSLYEELIRYSPFNQQEEKDKQLFLDFMDKNPDAFCRENVYGHITASSFIVNKSRTKVLFCYHNLYNSWSWTGGHADGEENLLAVAIKESKEETGVNAAPVTEDIFSVELLPVAGHIKRGEYVSSHIHYNVTYLLEADENERLSVCEDENSAVAWIDISDVENKSTEKWMIEKIYNKLTKKLYSDF